MAGSPSAGHPSRRRRCRRSPSWFGSRTRALPIRAPLPIAVQSSKARRGRSSAALMAAALGIGLPTTIHSTASPRQRSARSRQPGAGSGAFEGNAATSLCRRIAPADRRVMNRRASPRRAHYREMTCEGIAKGVGHCRPHRPGGHKTARHFNRPPCGVGERRHIQRRGKSSKMRMLLEPLRFGVPLPAGHVLASGAGAYRAGGSCHAPQ